MTDKSLTNRDKLGLRDLVRYDGKPYFWMPQTMKRLAAMGLAEEVLFTHFGKAVLGYRLTDQGRIAADLPS